MFHAANDHIAEASHPAPATAEHLDAHHLFGAGVVGDVQSGLHLDHNDYAVVFVARSASRLTLYCASPVSVCFISAAARIAAMSTCCERETIRSRSQRLSFERGGASMISTVSPSCDSLFSSCTWHTVRRRMNLPYRLCCTRRSISTRRDLFILSLLTTPTSCRFGIFLLSTAPRPPVAALCCCSGFNCTLRLDGFDAGNQAAIATKLAGGIEPFGLLLDAQAEQVLVRFLER